MPRHKSYVPHGVIPAVLLPFLDDLSIDEASFRKHLRDVTSAEGLSAVTINAHSTEVASCTFDEQRRVLEIAGDEIGDKFPLVNGIWADGSARSGAACQDGDRRRRLGAAGVPAGAVHDRPARRHGGRAFQAHRRRLRPAADRVPVSAGDRPGLSERDHAADDRGDPDLEGDQGLGRHAAAARVARAHAAAPVAAVQRAVDAELVADVVAELRLQGPAVRQRQRDRRPAGAAVPRGAGGRPRRPRRRSTTASIRWPACSTPSRGSTCTTA